METETKKCPYCAEEINKDAIKCKHCGEFLNKELKQKTSKQRRTRNSILITFAIIIIVFLGVSLPFHYILSGPYVFPKDHWTFSYTIITEEDIKEIVDKYNNASFFEKMAMNNEAIIRKLMEKGLIYEKGYESTDKSTKVSHESFEKPKYVDYFIGDWQMISPSHIKETFKLYSVGHEDGSIWYFPNPNSRLNPNVAYVDTLEFRVSSSDTIHYAYQDNSSFISYNKLNGHIIYKDKNNHKFEFEKL